MINCEQRVLRLLYCDTDLLIVSMNSNPFKFIKQYPEYFDNHVGSLKEGSGGSHGTLFIETKPKHYMYETQDSKKVRIAGLPKIVSNELTSNVFYGVLENGEDPIAKVAQIVTKNYHMRTIEIEKYYIDTVDDTRYYVDMYNSLPWG